MIIRAGQTVLLTGASGGLGTYIAEAFAQLGLQLALVAYPGVDLDRLRDTVRKKNLKAISINADLRDPAQRVSMLEQVRSELGEIDILINNAGIEYTSVYHDLPVDSLRDILNVNLEAPMVLTRLVLPEMLRRNSGHIVNVSSLAGRAAPAYQEPYVASKAGLIAFTYSLRATYRGTGVGASVIVPGFVEAGIYTKLKTRSGYSAPASFGTSKPERVSEAVIRAVERNVPEIIVNPLPVRPLLAFNTVFPSMGEWVTDKLGGNQFFKRVAEKIRSGKQ
jgi:short-subunit dehydrogenase